MRKFLFFSSLLFITPIASAQQSINIDSLHKVLAAEKTDSATLRIYLRKANAMRSDEDEARIFIGKWVIEQAARKDFRLLQAQAHQFMGVLYEKSSGFVLASEHLTQALAIAEQNNFYTVHANTLGSLGGMYLSNHQLEKAIEYYNKSAEIAKKNNYPRGLGVAYYNLGGAYFEDGYKDPKIVRKSIDLSTEGLRIIESIHDTASMITFSAGISSMYLEMGKLDSALLILNKAENLIRLSGHEESFATHYLRVAQIYQAQKNIKDALKYAGMGLDYAKKYNKPKWVYNYYTVMAQAYEGAGDYKNANKYNILYSDVHDSLVTAENFSKAADIQNKYQREKKEKDILKLNKDQEIATAKRKQLTAFLIIAVIGLLILATLLFLLLKNIRDRKKAYAQLEEKSIKIQEQALELSKQARLIARFQSQMNPHFVFNALHNIQGLVISNENTKATGQIQSLAQLMRKTFANAEKDDIPLEEEINYLKKYVDFERTVFDNKLDFDVNVSDKVESVLIPPMMIQPFIENSIKHAGLKTVENPYIKVLIDIEDNLLKISIRDNGVGLKKEADSFDKLSHSMAVIRSRIELLFQGKNNIANANLFSIVTVPETDSGTMVKFYLPLNYSY